MKNSLREVFRWVMLKRWMKLHSTIIFMIFASLVEWLGWKSLKTWEFNLKTPLFPVVCHNRHSPSRTNLNQFSRHKLGRQSTSAPSIVVYLIPNQWIIPESAFKQLIKIPRNATNRARILSGTILVVMCRPFDLNYVKIIIFMSVG